MARKKSRKKAQFGGLSAAAIKRAQEQAKKVQEAAKKPTSGFTGTRGTFTPTLSSPPAPVQHSFAKPLECAFHIDPMDGILG